MADSTSDEKAESNTAAAASAASSTNSSKVKVHLVAVGSAPILKKTKFQISADQRFASVIQFVRKMLKVDTVFLYCHSAFVPAPDQLVGDLRDCLAVRDELVIHYSLQEAWG